MAVAMSEKIQVGLIGFGKHGGDFLEPVLRDSEIAQVVAVVDINPDARKRAQDRGLAAYDTPNEMLARHNIEYVTVAVNHDQSRRALDTLANVASQEDIRLSVTTEKPIATDLRQAAEVVSTLRQAFEFAAVFNRFMYSPFVSALQDISRGSLGCLTTIHDEIIISGIPPFLDPWTRLSDPSNPSETRGIALQNGFHSASILALLVGIPKTISGSIEKTGLYPGTEVDDNALIQASYQNTRATYHNQWGAIPALVVGTQIEGIKGSMVVQQWGDVYQKSFGKLWERKNFDKQAKFADMHGNGNRLFHEAILKHMQCGDQMPHQVQHSLSIGIISQVIVEMGYASAASGGKLMTVDEVIAPEREEQIISRSELERIANLALLPKEF